MNTDSGTRGPASESGEAADRKPEHRNGTVATRRANTTRIALGSVVALLLLAAAAYYLVDRDGGTELAVRPSLENPQAATPTRPPETAETPARSTPPTPSRPPEAAGNPAPSMTPVPSSDPTAPQQSATLVQPPLAVPSPESRVAPPAPEPQAAPSTPTAQEQTNASPPEASKQTAESVESVSRNEPKTSAPAPAAPQPSMRDQAAAMPDPSAGAPKVETILVVSRGPAKIRSTPGKGGRIIGTAAKDAAVKELSRSGNWVEVETENGTGWIAATLLVRRSPQSR